ncbi:unnamed protein product [Linum tenue]|uniref:Uncharacterized protein n=1 Tax=Linum tenue TaxID=586396 RepID=A0AAV0KWV6_9ROSI|nr:unnamed protein product [Linum tenue]
MSTSLRRSQTNFPSLFQRTSTLTFLCPIYI